MKNVISTAFYELQEIVNNLEFKDQARKRAGDFSRESGKIKFQELIYFILKSSKSSNDTAVRRFFAELGREEMTVTQQSLSEARSKLTVWAFTHIFEKATVIPMMQAATRTWNNYFIYAVDGSKIALPVDRFGRLLEHYGTVGRGSTSPTAQASILYDVLNDLIIDASIEPIETDERSLALRHINRFKELNIHDQALMIFDRGYPSFELIAELEKQGIKFVMRVKKKFNLEIDAQVADDAEVWHYNKDKTEKVKVRVIKVKLDSGEIETLITNLFDENLKPSDFKTLYFLRWPIETKYDIVKNKLQVENFTAQTIEGIQQDFYATMFMANIMAAVEAEVKEAVDEQRNLKENKYEYKINKNELISILKDHFIVALSHDSSEKQMEELEKVFDLAQRYVVPIRPNRSQPRNPNPRKAKYHHNQKNNA
jgi:hypothetical protein